MTDSIISLRELGINSKQELQVYIQKSTDEKQEILNQIQIIESEMDKLSETMEQVETIRKYREHYKYHKVNPDDKNFPREYPAELKLYTVASKAIMEAYETVPKSKDTLPSLINCKKKRIPLCKSILSLMICFLS